MAKLEYETVQLNNGKILDGKKTGELVEEIINKFSEEGLTCVEAKYVLKKIREILGEYSIVQAVN
jgi:hypothetical protein|nr:MAG TPA: protein of unknown function (DUF4177) [Caudoviricetes sp.]